MPEPSKGLGFFAHSKLCEICTRLPSQTALEGKFAILFSCEPQANWWSLAAQPAKKIHFAENSAWAKNHNRSCAKSGKPMMPQESVGAFKGTLDKKPSHAKQEDKATNIGRINPSRATDLISQVKATY